MDMTRKAGLGLALLAVAALGATAPASAQTLYNTGFDSAGNLLPDGTAADGNYTLYELGSTPNLANATSGNELTTVSLTNGVYPQGPYFANTTTSKWIGPYNANSTDGQHLFGDSNAYFDYRTTVTLPAGATYNLAGQWATDNAGTSIVVNGVASINSIGSAAANPATQGFYSFHNFNLTGLKAGANQVDFIVYNGDYPDHEAANPTALRVEFGTPTVAPEPSSFAVFGFLGLGLGAMMLKSRKRSASAA